MEPKTADKTTFAVSKFSYRDAGFLSPLIIDYLAAEDRLKPFFNRFPLIENFSDQVEEKKKNYHHREALHAALKKQYSAAGLKVEAIDYLASENCFTVTTGHQVCLFTGPVYFFYKIISAIKSCRLLQEQHPDLNFVPVFWMATEDHDFDEANHFRLRSAKFDWESGRGGAVGRMPTEGLEEVAEALRETLGTGWNATELVQLFEKSYLNHDNITDATRFLVHSLFGEYGVVCVDGDDPDLKALAEGCFRKELHDSTARTAVENADIELSEHYNAQAHAREINLFYLDDQLRERIVRSAKSGFEVVNTDLCFSAQEMDALLKEHPERFSPNVILRPLYQELILPNLAYIGGGGELAYWFQLKGVFDAFGVTFPMLMLRNSVVMIESETREMMNQLGLSESDIFKPAADIEEALLKRESADTLQLDSARDQMEKVFSEVRHRLSKIDATLGKSVDSGHARVERIVDNLEKKMLRAERRKQEVLLNRLYKWRDMLFPQGSLQERNLNMAVFYMPYGKSFISELVDKLDPFDFSCSLVYAGKGD